MPSQAQQQQLTAAAANKTIIICAGLGTTGTSSVDRALNRLGLRTAKWGHVTTQPSGKEVPSNIMDSLMYGKPTFFALFNDVDAVLDSPAVDFLPFLLDTYPNARMILTHRNAKAWAKRRAKQHALAPKCEPVAHTLLYNGYVAWYAYVAHLSKTRAIPMLDLNVFEEDDAQLWAKLIPFVRGAGLGNQRRSQTPSAMGAFGETSADNHGMN